MPLGTAHDTRTPSRSGRRSQCRLVAWCSWMTKRRWSPPPFFLAPEGSGVFLKSRFRSYSPSFFFFAWAMSPEDDIFTVGHSTHGLEQFVGLLRGHEVELLVDVRQYPRSRRVPHFNSEALEVSLPEHGIEYLHMRELGGRRRPSPDSV